MLSHYYNIAYYHVTVKWFIITSWWHGIFYVIMAWYVITS